MTTERNDAYVLRTYGRTGKHQLAVTEVLKTWPLIVIPDIKTNSNWEKHYNKLRYKLDEDGKRVPVDLQDLLTILQKGVRHPFKKFGWISENKSSFFGDAFTYVYITGDPIHDNNATVNLCVNETTFVNITMTETRLNIDITFNGINCTPISKNAKNQEIRHRIALNYLVNYVELLTFLDYINHSDLYAVEVLPVTPVESKFKQLKAKTSGKTTNTFGPRIIYLDKLPTAGTGIAYGSRDSDGLQNGYHKRGHYRTLKHPMYCNHPKYLVPNGVYVKACWVGPETVTVEGNIYTLVKTT